VAKHKEKSMTFKPFKIWQGFFILILFAGFLVSPAAALTTQNIKTPGVYFGFKPGADRMLFDYGALISYLIHLDKKSPRLKLVEIGKSPLGKNIYIAFISAEENIKNLDTLKEINRKLALDPNIPAKERERLVEEGKVFFLATLSMHSSEVGPSQAAPLIAYDLVTTEDPLKSAWLENVVYMMVPCHNPDGMDMIIDHYKKYKGGKYEGCSMPGLYHKYVGHDNNRDFITLSQTDTRAIAGIYSLDWFPQVMVEKHQMGALGTRYFVPPNHDPIAENIDAGIWNWMGIFGSNMIKDMTKEGLAGISQHFLFDDYWPGSTETCIWKNVIGFLTEAAGVKHATPIFIEPNELSVRGKGLAEYKKSINMPLPWPGGWWRLGDIVQYEIVSTLSILKTASLHREDILAFRNDLCKKEVEKGKTKPPYYYILPLKQHDQSELVHLVNLLKEHGISVYRLSEDAVISGKIFKEGDIVVPLSQPFRPFIKEVMEVQHFPVRHYTPDGEIIKPYDITSWSLPLHRGITAVEVNRLSGLPRNFDFLLQKIEKPFNLKKEIPARLWAALLPVHQNESYKAAFLALKQGLIVHRLKEPVRFGVKGLEYPAGTFVVYATPPRGRKAGLESILNMLTVSPKILEKPAALETVPMYMPRIALVETYFHDMDAGWTRYILDTYFIPYTVIRPGDFETVDFTGNFDVVVFPDADVPVLLSGKFEYQPYRLSKYPPQYMKGIGKKGMERLLAFLDGGGNIVSWGRSAALFMGQQEFSLSPVPKLPRVTQPAKEKFELPVKDISEELKKAGLYCPGSLVKIDLLPDHPVTIGMPDQVGVFFRGRPVFHTRIPDRDMDRRVIGRFPEKNILLSGYCEKEEKVGNQAVLVWLKKNKGQLVLFGFNPQFRASTQGTFKLLFNSILLPKI